MVRNEEFIIQFQLPSYCGEEFEFSSFGGGRVGVDFGKGTFEIRELGLQFEEVAEVKGVEAAEKGGVAEDWGFVGRGLNVDCR